jgi:O-antigen/teichoic acid export membrane protein
MPRARVRSGAAAFLAGSVLVHAGNYAFNLVAVRLLDPAEYADVALTVTLLLFSGFITVGFQMATARTVAEHGQGSTGAAGLARWFGRRAQRIGLALGACAALASPLLSAVFRTESPLPFLAVALALPFAFAAGVRRGFAQGEQRFGRLALSFQAEMVVRLGLGAALMGAGFGVAGGVGAIAASAVAATLGVWMPGGPAPRLDPARRRQLLAALWPSLALLVGEGLVNHADTIIVKQAFDPVVAGQFAAVALIGRSVFFVTWPIAMLLFPIAARRAAAGEATRPVLVLAVGAVAATGTVATAIAAAAPEVVTRLILGPDYVALAHLLAPYIAATALFACAATIISFGVAVGADTAGYGAALAGFVCGLTLASFHPTLTVVVWLQVALMAVYLAVAAIWITRHLRGSTP